VEWAVLAARLPAVAVTAAATPAAAAAAAAAAVLPVASGPAAGSDRAGLIYNEIPPQHLLAVAGSDSRVGLRGVVDLNKTESSRIARNTIANEANAVNSDPRLGKPVLDVFLGRLERKVTYVKFHLLLPLVARRKLPRTGRLVNMRG